MATATRTTATSTCARQGGLTSLDGAPPPFPLHPGQQPDPPPPGGDGGDDNRSTPEPIDNPDLLWNGHICDFHGLALDLLCIAIGLWIWFIPIS
jgi:hypothetical protein